ncbi:MAG: psrP [Gallionellaceae bacterium]|nr:MAG: psrP [Gallionellaceae bacterium]
MKNREIIFGLLGLSLSLASAGAAFADVAGQAQFVNGEVRLIDAAGHARALRKGDAVNEGDTIDSAKDSSAQIKMQDGGFIAVRPDTKLKFDSFKFKGREDGTENSFFSLFKGGFRAVTGLIGRINKQNYRVTTPIATIGIRGTDHESFYAPVSLPGILAGAYSKVNIGETSLATEAGTISVKPNQMGHAGGLNQPPTLQPLNTNIFTVAPAPAKEVKKEDKEGAGGEQKPSAPGEQKVAAGEEAKKTAAASSEPAEVRTTAVVDNTSTAGATNVGATTPAATGPATTVALPPAVQETVPLTLVDPTSGITLNATAQTLTSSTGQSTSLQNGVFDVQAQAAAIAAQAAANAAQTALTAATANNVALAAIAQVNTAPATAAIGAATTGIGTAGTAVGTALALTPANAATATTNATSVQAAATTAASLAAAAQNAVTTNGAFADTALALPANTATQSANTALQSANTLVQTAAGSAAVTGSVLYYNAALSTAQGAASTALGAANTGLTTASASLTTASSQNAAIITAQGATSTPLAAALAAATAAQTAANAAQTAAAQAASLQAAGDFTGAQAQMVVAQQQLSIALAEQANAQTAQAAVATQLANAQAAQTATVNAVAAAINAANTAATDAGTASTQATAAQTAATNADAALMQTVAAATGTAANTVQAQAAIVATNAPIAAYNNPAVVAVAGGNTANGGFSHWGLAIKPAPKEEFIAQDSAQPQTTYVLDGNKNLVEIRNSTIDGNGYDYFNPSPVINNANVKLTGGAARDHFHFADNTGYMGRWLGGNVDVNGSPYIALGTPGAAGTTSLHWGIYLNPPSGYAQTLGGTASYTLDAATHPTDSFGNVGSLTGATLIANFDAQTVNAGVNFFFANNPSDPVAPSSKAMAFSASASNIPITGSTFDASPAGRGSLVFACTGLDCDIYGYQGDISGQFVGADAIHAALAYSVRALQPGGATATTAGGSAPHTDLIMGLASFSTAVAPTAASVTSAAYSPDYTLIELAAPFMTGGWNNYMAAPGAMVYTGASYLTAFTDSSAGGDGSIQTNTVIGGAGAVTGAGASVPSIMFGRWTSVTAMSNSHTRLIGGQNWDAPKTWMYGPQGYLDPNITASGGQMYGTFNYTLNGSTAPYDRQSGQSGTLTAAAITANFVTNTVSANLGLAVGGQLWAVSTIAPVSLSGNQFSTSSNPGGASNNLSIDMGQGTPTLCTTCFGTLDGAFTAQNYYGAILSYNLWNSGVGGGDVVGHATLVRSGAITDGTPVTPVSYFVADQGGDIKQVDTLNSTAYSQVLTPGGALTSYSSGNSANPGAGYMATSVATSSTSTITSAQSGIVFGTWSGGSYTSSWGTGIGAASPHWITGPEAGPLFLPNALVGTKAYTFDGGMVTNMNGAAGTVLGTTALTVDFTKQVVGINIDLSVPDSMSTLHAWNAQTLPGNEAPINSGDGIGGATFRASSYNQAAGPGLLTVVVDGATPGSGNVSGQLIGAGLNGAILSYDLSATFAGPPYLDRVNGVAAFAGATSNTATPYRWVMTSLTDPTAIIQAANLGFYANAPARMTASVGGAGMAAASMSPTGLPAQLCRHRWRVACTGSPGPPKPPQ